MSGPARQKQTIHPKDSIDSRSKEPENWPDVPENQGVENVEKQGTDRVEQMRHADNSDDLSNSTTGADKGVVGYTDALVDEELDRKGGREELL